MGTSITSTGVTFPDATTQTTAATSAFAAGTVMLFAQTAAPTGWTKDATNYNGSAIRVVTGAASTGGSVDFTTAFASQTPAGSVALSGGSIGNTTAGGSISVTVSAGTLAVGAGTLSAAATTLSTAQMPSHTHTTGNFLLGAGGSDFYSGGGQQTSGTGSTGGGGSHTHSVSGSPSLSGSPSVTGQTFTGTAHNHTLTNPTASFTGTAINLAVKYVDVIRATKD